MSKSKATFGSHYDDPSSPSQDCSCNAPPPSGGESEGTPEGGSLISADIGGNSGGTGSLVDVNVAASDASHESATSLISADVGGDSGGGTGSLVDVSVAASNASDENVTSLISADVGGAGGGHGSLFDLDIAPSDASGEVGSLLARIAGGGILDATADQGEHDAGVGLQVAALAGEGLLDIPNLLDMPGQLGSDCGIVGGGDVLAAVTSLVGDLSLPEGLGLGGILDHASC